MNHLHLITPGFRPAYIQKILSDLVFYRNNPFIWHLIMDEKVEIDIQTFKNYDKVKNFIKFYKIPTIYNYGFEQRLFFLEKIAFEYNSDDWGYFLDDDNLLTPDIFTAFNKYINDEQANIVLMSQLRYDNPNKRLYGRPGHACLGMVDIGNFIFKLRILRGVKINVNNYSEDGALMEYISKTYPESLRYEDCLMTTYNILKV